MPRRLVRRTVFLRCVDHGRVLPPIVRIAYAAAAERALLRVAGGGRARGAAGVYAVQAAGGYVGADARSLRVHRGACRRAVDVGRVGEARGSEPVSLSAHV